MFKLVFLVVCLSLFGACATTKYPRKTPYTYDIKALLPDKSKCKAIAKSFEAVETIKPPKKYRVLKSELDFAVLKHLLEQFEARPEAFRDIRKKLVKHQPSSPAKHVDQIAVFLQGSCGTLTQFQIIKLYSVSKEFYKQGFDSSERKFFRSYLIRFLNDHENFISAKIVSKLLTDEIFSRQLELSENEVLTAGLIEKAVDSGVKSHGEGFEELKILFTKYEEKLNQDGELHRSIGDYDFVPEDLIIKMDKYLSGDYEASIVFNEQLIGILNSKPSK